MRVTSGAHQSSLDQTHFVVGSNIKQIVVEINVVARLDGAEIPTSIVIATSVSTSEC